MFGGRVLLSNVTFSSTASGGATPLNPSAFPVTFVPVPAGAYVSFFPEKLGPDGTVIPMIRALTNQYIDVTFGFRLSVLSTDQFLGNVIADRWGADTDVLQGVPRGFDPNGYPSGSITACAVAVCQVGHVSHIFLGGEGDGGTFSFVPPATQIDVAAFLSANGGATATYVQVDGFQDQFTLEQAIPEPPSWLLMAFGALVIGMRRYMRP